MLRILKGLLILGLLVSPVLAEESIPVGKTETIQNVENTTTEVSTPAVNNQATMGGAINDYNNHSKFGGYTAGVEPVELEDANNKILGKAYQIADLVRGVAIPIIVLMSIASAVSLIWGALSKKQTVWPGIFGLLTCGLAYTVVMYGPQILYFFSTWLWS